MSNARDDREWLGDNQESMRGEPVASRAEEIGDMHYSAENYSTALEYFHSALQAPDLPPYPDRFRILLKISDSYRLKGSYEDASRFLEGAATLTEGKLDDEAAGAVEYRRASIAYRRGRYEEALQVGFEAFRRLKDTDRHVAVADIQLVLANCYHRMGLLSEAEEFFSDALSTYRRVDHRVGIAHVYNNIGLLHKVACRWNRALASLNKSLDIARELGMTQHVILVELNLGVVYGKLRRFADAISTLSSAASTAERMGDHLQLTRAILALGRTHVQTGDLAKAEKHLMRAQTLTAQHGYVREGALADEFIGELMFVRRQYPEARANLLGALKEARRIAPEGDIVAECLRRLAEVELQLGDAERALAYVEEGLRVANRCEPYELGYLQRARAGCLSRAGRPAEAIESLERSVSSFAEHANAYERACSLRLLARARMRSKDETDWVRAKQLLSDSIVEFGKLDEAPDQIVSQILLASVEQRLGNIDGALLAVYEADRLAEEQRSARFGPALRALRAKIEARMTRSTRRVLDHFSVLGDIQSGARSRDHLVTGLASTLALILERLEAGAGFIAIPRLGGRSLQVVARTGTSAKEARAIVSWFGQRGGEDTRGAVLISDVGSAPELEDLRKKLASPQGTMLLQGLGFEGEGLGVLCVHQAGARERGPLGQDALHFVAAYANLISLSIFELVRHERRDRRRSGASPSRGFQSVVTENKEMIDLLNLAERVAHSDATVLLQGETGTGKGLIAYAIHLLSERRDRKFVHVNCAALPEQLLESELFGHVRGAFTGAHADKAGLLQEANGGTVFLDEISKTSLAMQGKLLQFLDTSTVRRVGSNDSTAVDVRVVCASKSNLLDMCEDGRFLEDFYYRINDFPLTVPPLRERREDIPLLAQHYIEKCSREMDKEINGATEAFLERLHGYRWPGNVRELEKVIKRAVILADDGDALDVTHLAPEIGPGATRGFGVAESDLTLRERIAQIEYDEIVGALRRHAGNKSQAAIQLGISYPNLLAKIKRYNIQ